ncbi:MAG: heme exporter protein CcmD [Pseudomonadota bacterium]
MREALEHWDFVVAAYAIGLGGLAALLLWSWQSMRRAEQRRDEVKRR